MLCRYNQKQNEIYLFPSNFCLDSDLITISHAFISRFRGSSDSKNVSQRGRETFRSCDGIGFHIQNIINIKRENSLGSFISKGYIVPESNEPISILSELSSLIRKSQFGLSVQSLVQSTIFIIKVLFKVKLIQLSFFVPISNSGFSVVSVQYGIVMHQLYLQTIRSLILIKCQLFPEINAEGLRPAIRAVNKIKKKTKCLSIIPQTLGILQQFNFYEINYHQPSLVRKIFFSSSLTSCEKSLIATAEHFLFLVTFLFLSYLQMPRYSPKVSPSSISITGTLFLPARPLTSLTQLASLQFLARMTYLALSFSSLFSRALQTSWSPLARRESELQVWMILLRAVSQSATWVSAIDSDGNKYYIKYLINLPILKLFLHIYRTSSQVTTTRAQDLRIFATLGSMQSSASQKWIILQTLNKLI